MEENKKEEVEVEKKTETEAKKTFDDVLTDKEYQAEFDRRISKAITTAKAKWESENKGDSEKGPNTAELAKRIAELEKNNRNLVIDSLITAEALANGVKKDKLSYLRKCVDEDFYDDKGNVDAKKVQANVAKVLEDFPELKGTVTTGMEHGASSQSEMSGVEKRFYELNPHLKAKK